MIFSSTTQDLTDRSRVDAQREEKGREVLPRPSVRACQFLNLSRPKKICASVIIFGSSPSRAPRQIRCGCREPGFPTRSPFENTPSITGFSARTERVIRTAAEILKIRSIQSEIIEFSTKRHPEKEVCRTTVYSLQSHQ